MSYNNNSQSLNNINGASNNKYKLVKTNNAHPLTNQYNLLNTSTRIASLSNLPYNKPAPTTLAASSFKVDNSTSLILNKTLESSSKLDDLLKRCREIGSSDMKVNNDLTKPTSSNTSFMGEILFRNNYFRNFFTNFLTKKKAPKTKSIPNLELTKSKFQSKYKLSNSITTKLSNVSKNSLQLNSMNNSANKFKLNNKIQFNAQLKKPMAPFLSPSNFKINRLKS